MANHKSALKRAKQSEIKRLRNMAVKTKVKNIVKKVHLAAEEKSEDISATLNNAISLIDKAASKGVIHRNTAGRKISRLSHYVKTASAK